jgi:hypothetical protein
MITTAVAAVITMEAGLNNDVLALVMIFNSTCIQHILEMIIRAV